MLYDRKKKKKNKYRRRKLTYNVLELNAITDWLFLQPRLKQRKKTNFKHG